jgi:hypothetical protein
MLLGQPWLVRVGVTIKYGGTTEGNHGMDIQVYEKGNLSGSSVSLHALMNEEREQDKLVHTTTAIPPEEAFEPWPTDWPIDGEGWGKPGPAQPQYQYKTNGATYVRTQPKTSLQNYEYYHTEVTPSDLSLKGDSPIIPTISKELSEAL